MAAENIESVSQLFQEFLGARRLVVGTVKLPAKYKTEGCVISDAQLRELGLPNAQVDCGWIVTSGKAAKNAEAPIVQLNIVNPAGTLTQTSAQVVSVQSYESITTAIQKEEASEGTKAGGAVVTVALIGR